MAKFHIYLNFDGNCAEAFDFYAKVFRVPNLGTHRYGDMLDGSEDVPETTKNLVLHTALQLNEHTQLMGSDIVEALGSDPLKKGNQTYAMIDTESAAEATRLFDELSINAKNIEMNLESTFFAELYASFQDQFGISWMIHFEGNANFGGSPDQH